MARVVLVMAPLSSTPLLSSSEPHSKSQLESQMAHVTVLEQLATFLTLSLANPDSSTPLRAVWSEASIES